MGSYCVTYKSVLAKGHIQLALLGSKRPRLVTQNRYHAVTRVSVITNIGGSHQNDSRTPDSCGGND